MQDHTTFKIGGPAKYFVEPKDIQELKLLLKSAKRYNIPILVIGAGSNILINDNGVRAIVLRLNSPIFKKIFFHNNRLNVASGVVLSQILKLTQKQGLSGLEFLAGIPGTVGGALAMNAGISKKIKNQSFDKLEDYVLKRSRMGQKSKTKNIGSLVESVKVMDYNGKIKILNKKDIKFGYRKSNLSKYIILSALLKLRKRDKREIENEIKRYFNYRKETQDLSRASAGCIFKNPKGNQAGRLIDLSGLKGKRIGDASISRMHANFILNLSNATAKDVLKLMDLVRKEVKNKFNVTLEPEIKIWQ